MRELHGVRWNCIPGCLAACVEILPGNVLADLFKDHFADGEYSKDYAEGGGVQ